MKYFVFYFALLGTLLTLGAGENLLFNSGFELGKNGYSGNRRIDYVPGTEIRYTEPTPSVSTQAYAGRASLKITREPNDHGWNFVSHEFTLKPGKKYTFSAWVRSSNVSHCSFNVFSAANYTWYTAGRGSLKVTPQWKRQSFSFTYDPPETRSKADMMNQFFIFGQRPGEKSELYMDNIQLEEGELTDYKPMHELESAVNSPAFVIEDPSVTAQVSAVSQKSGKQTIQVELADKLTGKVFETKKVSFDLTAAKGVTIPVTFEKVPYGGLVFRTKDPAPFGAGESWFVRLHKNDRQYGSGFQVGIHGTHGELITWKKWRDGENMEWIFTDTLGNRPGDLGKILRMAGATHFEAWYPEAFSFSIQNQDGRGKFDWKVTDALVDNARKNQLKIAYSLLCQSLMGSQNNRSTGRKGVPDWLRKLDRCGKPLGDSYGDWKGNKIVLPPPEVLGEYVVQIAKRYRKDLMLIRLFPEANGYMTPQILHEYAAVFYPAAKKAAPEVPVITLTPTEDMGSKIGKYMEDCFKLGTGKYTDHLAIHPYCSATDDAVISAMTGIREMNKLRDRYKKDAQIWNTEVYHLTSVHGGNQWVRDQFLSDAIIRRFCIDAGEGVSEAMPLFIRALFAPPHQNICRICSEVGGLRPTDRFAAYNASSYFLCGSTGHKVVFTEGNVLCYVFRNQGKTYSVIWSIDGKAEQVMPLPAGVKVRAYDLFGNLAGTHSKEMKMKLTRHPVFLEWQGAKCDPVQVHRAARISNHEEFRIESVKILHDAIRIYLTNKTATSKSGFIRIQSDHMKTRGKELNDIPAFATTAIDLPMKYTGQELNGDVQGTVLLAGSKAVIKHAFRLPKLERFVLPFETALSSQAKMKMEQKQDQLLITVLMSKASFTRPEDPKAPWYGSSLEFFFDMAPQYAENKRLIANYTPYCCQIVFSTASAGDIRPVSPQKNPAIPLDKIKCALKKEGAGYIATVTIPMPKQNFAMNVQTTEFKKTLIWKGEENYKKRNYFQMIKINSKEK